MHRQQGVSLWNKLSGINTRIFHGSRALEPQDPCIHIQLLQFHYYIIIILYLLDNMNNGSMSYCLDRSENNIPFSEK